MQEIQEFDPRGHVFKVGRHTYHLPLLNLDMAAEFYRHQNAGEAELLEWMPRVLAENATCTRPAALRWLSGMPSPSKAVRSLAATQQAKLFTAWMRSSGVMPGESSRSANS